MPEGYASEAERYISSIAKGKKDPIRPTREQFARLLAGPAAARKTPGIPDGMDENGERICGGEEAAAARAFIKKTYGIDSAESLIGSQRYAFRCSVQYEQFMTFWKKAPLFDPEEMDNESRKEFERSIALAGPFFPVLGEKGFYAWDICEYIGVCRTARACGIIDGGEFDGIVDPFVRKAQVFYRSFKEYALSYICGALYFSASNFGPQGLDRFFEIQKSILKTLFGEKGIWRRYGWYEPAEREWARIYPGDPGCFATVSALDNGVGYMYRETPDRPDSGWRFFHGDETDDYANDPANIRIVSLNTICNLCPSVLAFLEAPVNSAYGWNGRDWIREKRA